MANAMTGVLHFTGLLRDIHYQACLTETLKTFPLAEFDINRAKASGIIQTENTEIAYSKWVSPKRTQSASFARVYNSYSASNRVSKILTIIPVLKDDGRDGDLDKIHYSTFSWMNLLNTYIVLGYHDHADKNSKPGQVDRQKLTNHRFNNASIRSQIQDIVDYKKSAFHWNTHLLETQFTDIFRKALDAYWQISDRTGVKIHGYTGMDQYLDSVKADFETFQKGSLKNTEETSDRSPLAHALKYLVSGSRATFCIETDQGGVYPLSPESIFWVSGRYIIQESRNAPKKPLPDLSDIQDGLLKLLPYSTLETLQLNGEAVEFSVRLKLTGCHIISQLMLPASPDAIATFLTDNTDVFNQQDLMVIQSLNLEAEHNKHLEITIGGS